MEHGIMPNSGHYEIFFTCHFKLINFSGAQFKFVFVVVDLPRQDVPFFRQFLELCN